MAYTVKELRELVAGLPEEMPVVVVLKTGSVKQIDKVAFSPMAGGLAVQVK